MSGLSIIIPVLNEERLIERCLMQLAALRRSGVEVIVVDGGSHDGTVHRARQQGVRRTSASTGRAAQMNAGAQLARGDLLAFLHVDTLASDAALSRLVQLAGQGTHCWGRFDICIDDRGWPFRLIAACMNLRSRLSAVATGDQLIFVHRGLFEAVGGFPSIALMEDVSLSKSLRRIAAPLCCRETVLTSARRWRRRGTVRTIALMWWLRLRYAMGADPQQLARMYRAAETDAARRR